MLPIRLLAFLSVSLGCLAEPVTVTFEGKVLDATRAPIAGAKVSAAPAGGGDAVSTSTNAAGIFSLSLRPGTYTVQAVADGFLASERTVRTGAISAGPYDIELRVAPKRETVTVTEEVGYRIELARSATKTLTALRDTPQSISIVSQELIRDQSMQNMADVVRYVPGITMAQGEGHRDAPVIRGNSSTADFFVDGVRDDVQYMRDLYNADQVEALKGPNAMIFGRGGGGGVINRVTKQAGWAPVRELFLQGGTFGNRRLASDFGHAFNDSVALRFNAMYENSDSFRRFANIERYGVNPTLSINAGSRTKVMLGYEHFSDDRVVDRGMPSYRGRPSGADIRTFFGNPDQSYAEAKVNLGSAVVDHQTGRVNLRNRFVAAGYDKFYSNVLPGAVNADQSTVTITGYNSPSQRRNVFNQTDGVMTLETGAVKHTILTGAEFGRQSTDNFRNTAYFNNTATSIVAPFLSPTIFTPATFRQSASDADNHVTANIAAVYVQDQIALSRHVQVIAGVRYDSFDLKYRDNRTGLDLSRRDGLISPRAGVVVKPLAALSLYGSYSVSYLPSSGDQFASLTATTQTLKPEKFNNYEAGAKWDIARNLAFTAAVFRLDRLNTTAPDPNTPGRIVQTGAQRTKGFEMGLSGSIRRRWQVQGGYSYQDAYITRTTSAAPLGNKALLVPHHTLSLWNNYQIATRLGAGLGIIHQADMFAAIDNAVTLPSFTRVDAAVFYSLTENTRLQANLENVGNTKYYPTSHGNNNILPGSPRALRVGLTVRF